MRVGRTEATAGFFLLWAWLNYLDTQGVVPFAMAACLCHELGHCFALGALGGRIKAVRLTAVGAELVLDRPLGYWQEGAAALAGPGVNLILALLSGQREEGLLFSGVNLMLGCFNLLPISRLDGGRAMYCTLALVLGPQAAGVIQEGFDLFFTAVSLAAGWDLVWKRGNITLLLVALWLTAAKLSGYREP